MRDDVFLKFDYGVLDMARGARLRLLHAPGGRVRLAAGLAVAVSALVLLAVLVYPRAPDWARALAGWLLVLGSVHGAFTAFKAAPYAMFVRGTGARGPVVREDLWSRKMSVDASEEGIIVTVGQRSATLKWQDCGRLDSDAWSHVIYHGAKGFLLVPRRAFRTEKQDASFRELALAFIQRDSASMPVDSVRPPAEPSSAPAPAPESAMVAGASIAAGPKVGRNAPCPCGSGKKYKKCCMGAA